jgi:tRNA G10  N-methylase Trm11
MNEYEDKVNTWLDQQTQEVFRIDSAAKPQNRERFLRIIATRQDYMHEGETICKVHKISYGNMTIQDVQDFFSKFDYPKNHESSFGAFRNYGLKKFIEGHIECTQNQKIHQRIRKAALITLIRLKTFLSTGKADYQKASKSAKL